MVYVLPQQLSTSWACYSICNITTNNTVASISKIILASFQRLSDFVFMLFTYLLGKNLYPILIAYNLSAGGGIFLIYLPVFSFMPAHRLFIT
ncbi:hypothetical protein Bresa_01754|uniref:Uncharacterized protein n=1 Tax=Brenneria salicis ATCC 15712 = DSM 30166 TaxID=714314 RepID=A0A366I6S6_9GAMM|nr:hypothetical protein [Brenneria salicis ATCC 15712 = DSM 30166]RBP63028.1 hypothetical protein DES54_11342 [Brenneria salicis ATCC 15712 = DSM 30166]RLM30810.1 hypothetical protein BHG07_08780 [Brenneria salicis ATCC 15712 = DSM 30166]